MNSINSEDWIGKVTGSYRLVVEIGRGRSGVVFLAEHTQRKEQAAVKIFPPGKTTDSVLANSKLLSTLSHPGLVEVYDCGRVGDCVYVVMEYVRFKGETAAGEGRGEQMFTKNLTEYIQEQSGLMREHVVVELLCQIIDVLEYAHAMRDGDAPGLPYGGIHPNSILLEDLGSGHLRVRLTDLGVPVERERRAAADAYLSPEELQGQPATKESDVYSVGAIAYSLLVGVAPPSPVVPPTEIRGDISAGWNEVIRRTLAYEPEKRYSDCHALRTALLDVRRLIPKRLTLTALKTAVILFAVIGAVALVVAVVTQMYQRRDEQRKKRAPSIPARREAVAAKPTRPTPGASAVTKAEAPPRTPEVPSSPPSDMLDMAATAAISVVSELPGGTAAAPSAAPAATPAVVEVEYTSYTIRKNDTLWNIAWEHRMSVKELQFINGLSTDAVIKVGRELKVRKGPKRPPRPRKKKTNVAARVEVKTDSPQQTTSYRVKKGDTYFNLARKYGCTVKQLEELNGKKLLVGKTIEIPVAAN